MNIIGGIINKKNKTVSNTETMKMYDFLSGTSKANIICLNNICSLSSCSDSVKNCNKVQLLEFKNYVIIYHGEIYNLKEIQDKLQFHGCVISGKSEIELVLESYDKWKNDCVLHFNGVWNFAIYDKDRDIVFCSRDRLGVKPFYYSFNDDIFIFGITIKQLLPFIKHKVNKRVLIDFIITGFAENSTESFFSDIYKLPAGANLIYDLKTHEFQISKYYTVSIDKGLSALPEDKAINYYENILKNSIAVRLDKDRKAAFCLSGGLDSSSVAALTSDFKYKNFSNAIHAKSLEKEQDESKFALLVAESLGLTINIIEPTVQDFQKYIEDVVYTQEEPFSSTSICMQYFVMKKAHDLGIYILFDGQGGDETLLGYERYYAAFYVNVLKRNGFFALLKVIKEAKKNNSKMTFLKTLLFSIYFMQDWVRIRTLKKKVQFLNDYENDFSFIKESAKNFLDINAMQIHEITEMNLPALLRYNAKNTIPFDIDVLLPFLDYKVLEAALSIDVNLKIRNGWSKYILRQLVASKLPDPVVWRKNKFGFEAPENTWINSIDASKLVFESVILNNISDMRKLKKDFFSLDKKVKWRLVIIALWEKAFNVTIS